MTSPEPSSSSQLRDQVIEAATRRFNRHGFKSVTMDDIARELGMSKKTLYQVVANKVELIELTLDCDMIRDEALIERVSAEAHDAVDAMLRIARHFTEQMRDINPAALYDLHKYYRPSWERLDAHHNDKMIGHVRANLRRGQDEGLYRDNLNRELIAHLFVQGPQAFMNPERFPLKQHEWDDVLNQFMRYHLNGVVSERGRELLKAYLSQGAEPKTSIS